MAIYRLDTQRPRPQGEMQVPDLGRMLTDSMMAEANAIAQMQAQQAATIPPRRGPDAAPAGAASAGTPLGGGHYVGDGHDHPAVPGEGQHKGQTEAARKAWAMLTGGENNPYATLGIVSGFRDPAHNRRVGGASGSQHQHGNAYDVNTTGWDNARKLALIQKAWDAGFRGIGVYNNNLHFDVASPRFWGPSYRNASTPAWARPLLERLIAGV